MAELARVLDIGQADLGAAAAILGSLVDEDFRRRCSVAGVGGGVVTIHVSDPGLVAGMRLVWSGRLLAALQGVREFSSVRRVAFEYGEAGVKLRG